MRTVITIVIKTVTKVMISVISDNYSNKNSSKSNNISILIIPLDEVRVVVGDARGGNVACF